MANKKLLTLLTALLTILPASTAPASPLDFLSKNVKKELLTQAGKAIIRDASARADLEGIKVNPTLIQQAAKEVVVNKDLKVTAIPNGVILTLKKVKELKVTVTVNSYGKTKIK